MIIFELFAPKAAKTQAEFFEMLMKKPKIVEIPGASLLAGEPRDWYDAYAIVVDGPMDTWTVGEFFLRHTPWWARFLFAVRNAGVRCFGLKADSMSIDRAQHLLETFRTMPEEAFPQELDIIGAKIFAASNREIVAGADDWHLDFRGSVLAEPNGEQTAVTLTTVVRFRHWFGRLYFLPVKPFHKLIVRRMLQRLAQVRRKEREAS